MHVNVVKCVVNLRAFFRLYMMVMVIIDTFIVCTNNILLNKPKQQVFIIFSLITSAKVIAEHNNRREISLDVEFYLLSILVQCITNQLSYSSAHFFFFLIGKAGYRPIREQGIISNHIVNKFNDIGCLDLLHSQYNNKSYILSYTVY